MRVGLSSLGLVLALVIASCVPAARGPRPVTSGLEARIDTLFADVTNRDSPGVAVYVVENGEVLARRAYGLASLEHRIPFTERSVVRLPYSEAREFIAIAAILMERDKLLSLDAKVRTFFPELPAWSDAVTIWDLLNHRSGFVDEWAVLLLSQNSMKNHFTEAQFLRLLATQLAPTIAPKQGYLYSNSDFGLLRLILEKAAGRPLRAWMKARMFEPLGMTSTRLHDDALEVIPNFAIRYEPTGSQRFRIMTPDKTSPGGNYFVATTAEDLVRWAAAHADGASQIAQAVARLNANVRTVPGKRDHRAFGHSSSEVMRHAVIHHQGVLDFVYLSRVPTRNLAVITLGNRDRGYTAQHHALIDHLLDARAPEVAKPVLQTTPIQAPVAELHRYVGRYVLQDQVSWQSHVTPRVVWDLYVDDGVLHARIAGGRILKLIAVANGVFFYRDQFGAQFTLTELASGDMQLTTTYDDGLPGDRLLRESVTSWSPTAQALARYTGRYHDRHLDFTWTIALDDNGALIIRRPTVADTRLEPDGQDRFRFVIEDGYGGFSAWVTFHGAGEGAPSHLTVAFERLLDHRFDRVPSP